MSEYQYYEFLAIDRLLTQSEIKELRKLSTRAEITSTRFTNTYNWGDFGGSPEKLMEKYFDAHVYVTNWGTYNLMLRFPRGVIDEDILPTYCIDDPMSFWLTDEHVIISWLLMLEEGMGWVEGEGWIDQLIPIREEIEKGDYRSLYIGFLLAILTGLPDYDTTEPPVPPGLADPTDAQKSLIKFLQIDKDLMAAAASASEPLVPRADQTENMRELIDQLQVDEMRKMLLQILRGESVTVQSELRRRYNQFLKQMKASDDQDVGSQRRTAPQLFELMEEAKRKRKEREELELQRKLAAEERERKKYLAGLVEKFPETWRDVERLTGEMTNSSYERTVELLVDLSDAYDQAGRFEEFETRFSSFVSKHKRKSSLTRKMREAGLMPSSAR
jgi:hypothetical protein